MPKEITLDMLAETSKPVQKPEEEVNEVVEVSETVESTEQKAQEKPSSEVPKPNPKDNSKIGPKMGVGGKIDKKMKPMDASQMAQQLIKDGVMEAKKDETEEHPIVQNAFTALEDTIKEREKNIDNLLETMQENAEEDKLNKELGMEDDDDDSDEKSDNNIEDDLEAELERQQNYSSDKKSEDSKKKSVKEELESLDELDFDDDDEDEEKPEPKKESKPVEVKKEPEDEDPDLASDDAELDTLIKEIDADDPTSEDDTTETESDKAALDRYKKAFKSVKIIRDPIDLSKFTISDTPESNKFILKNIKSSENLRRADWVLYHTQRSMTFKECNGPELETLRRVMENGNDTNRIKASLEFIYNHIYDANKPTFEDWTKLIRTEDVDSMYYGIYKACYSDSNLMARTCSGCGKTSLINIPIEDMVVYGTPTDDQDKIKKKFNKIFSQDTTTPVDPFKSELMQISDEYVVAYSPASLFSTFIMYSTLNPEVTERFAETLNTMSYIDKFFYIDRENSTLKPIKVKEYKDDLNKSVLSKLKVYKGILDTLNNDQYNVFMSSLNKFVMLPKISYIMPKCVCPECGREISESPIEGSMLNMLFTRAQLARIVNL